MNTRFSISFCLLLLVVAGCKKKVIPEEMEEAPVFWVKGNFNGSQQQLTAGEDGYYMFTAHSLDDQDRYLLEGRLADANCETCPENLRIRFRSSQAVVPGVPPDIDKILHLGEFPYLLSDALDQFRVGFVNFSQGNGALDLKWDFGDGTTSQEANPTHVFTHQRNHPDSVAQSFGVTLQIEDVNGCVDEIFNEVIPDDARCASQFVVSDTITDVMTLQALARGEPPFEFEWAFFYGNEVLTVNSRQNPLYQLDLREGLPDKICLTVTDQEDCENKTCINLKSPNGDCLANYTYEKQGRVFTNPGETEVVIGWTDESGTRFRSDRLKQPITSYFEVLSSEVYDANERDEETRRLRIRFSCELYDEEENVFVLEGVEGFFGVAHP